ncbi:MAG: hydrogenase nickel incorporation protein HypB [Planctomycetes bacterium]|nr:hydrogenase nickel incorporation protein HypB [Planctomycetota bacterium]
MKIEVLRKSLLATNERAAEENRSLFDRHGTVAVNLMGGAGCGKTSLLESIIPQLRPRWSVGVLEGDIATTRDAERIAALGVPVVQILTEGGCHLTASLVQHALERMPLEGMDILFIENVGNPICPANFDLGEHHRVAVLSVTEGDDKPLKYPYLFKVADLVVVSKADLLSATDFDVEEASRRIRTFDPCKPIMVTSARTFGMTDLVAEWFEARIPGYCADAVDQRELATTLPAEVWFG